MSHRIRILIADDNPGDLKRTKSLLLQQAGRLYEDERASVVDTCLEIVEARSIPDALECLKKSRMPDISIVDLNFKYASKHLETTDGAIDEGVLLMRHLKSYPGMYVFCLSAYLDWSLPEIIELSMHERAVKKDQPLQFTKKIGEALRDLAQRHLAYLNHEEQLQICQALDQEEWQELRVTAHNRRFLLKNLMIGWAEVYYDLEKQGPALRYPSDMISIIKQLLTNA